jgi:heterotetrameric sarcosine oxidase delta subunit
MILIRCPWCGPRDAGAVPLFREVSRPRPDPASATPEWRDYLYFPANPRGQVTETWYHRMGCRKFFTLQRDTDTNESRPVDGPGGIGGDQGFVPPGASRAGPP